MAKLEYPWAIIVSNTMDDEVEITVHKSYELAKKALVDDILDEANIKSQDGINHEVDTSVLDAQDCAMLNIMHPSGLHWYHYMWQIVRIPEPED